MRSKQVKRNAELNLEIFVSALIVYLLQQKKKIHLSLSESLPKASLALP